MFVQLIYASRAHQRSLPLLHMCTIRFSEFLLIAVRRFDLSLCEAKAPKIVYNENNAEASINMDSWALIPEKWLSKPLEFTYKMLINVCLF